MSKNIGVVFAFGPGELELQAWSLIRSLRHFGDFDEILAYTTTEEIGTVSEALKTELETDCIIQSGPKPLDSYPISIKQAALSRAASILDTDYLLCLDTDILVLDGFDVPECNSDLYLKPVDIGGQYYGSEQSYTEWRSLAETFGMSFPGATTKSTVDKKPIPPYWNAGMVLTRNNDFPDKWLSLTKALFEKHNTGYFTDQVALGLLSTEYEVCEVGEQYNYPLTHRVFVPDSISILHYNTFYQLARIYDPRIFRKILKTDVFRGLEKDRDTAKSLAWQFLKAGRRRINHVSGY